MSLLSSIFKPILGRCYSSSRKAELFTDFKWFLPIQTRIKDNDVYGHVNNAVHHAMFDTAVNVYLIRHCGLDMSLNSRLVGYMVRTECSYTAPVSFPNLYLSGLRVAKLGNSSIDYELALFPPVKIAESIHGGADCVRGHFSDAAAELLANFGKESLAFGRCTHVFVDPTVGNKPTRIPDEMRNSLGRLLTSPNL